MFPEGLDPPHFDPVDCRRLMLERHRRGDWIERWLRVAKAEGAQAPWQPRRCRRRTDIPRHMLDAVRQPADLGDYAGDLIRGIGEPKPTDARPPPVRADRETETLVGVPIEKDV